MSSFAPNVDALQHAAKRRSRALRFSASSFVVSAMLLAAAPLRAQQASAAPEIGVEQRLRSENWNNLFDFSHEANDEREQIRWRTRVWTRVPLGAHVEIQAGLNSESSYRFGQTNRWDEVVFDLANITIRDIGVKGLSLKAGRQDLMRGEGLVLFEGTSGDGSRTLYFNALDLAYTFRKSNLELMGILNPREERFLPRFNNQRRTLSEWDEQALGLYYTEKNIANTTWEGYYFHKKETGDRRAATNPQRQLDRRVETAGGRMRRSLSSQWTVTGEFARQWGSEITGRPIAAWGGYAYATRNFNTARKPYLTAGYFALSGDDPARNDRISGWDPLFARWPKWGDLELYAQAVEKGVGYATNQKRLYFESGFTPRKGSTLKLIYYRLSAFHPFAGKPSLYGPGTDRGQDLQARLDLQFHPAVRGHIELHTLLPGDYYAGKDRSYFLRFELTAQAKTLLAHAIHQ